MTITTAIFTDTQTKVVAALAAVSITCYPYESKLIDAVPCATLALGAPDGAVGIGVYGNESYRIGQITWTLRYYVDAEEGDDGTAQLNMQSGIVAIMQALGADRTLGGSCRWSDLGDGNVHYVTTGGVTTPLHSELMFEAPLVVTPHPRG